MTYLIVGLYNLIFNNNYVEQLVQKILENLIVSFLSQEPLPRKVLECCVLPLGHWEIKCKICCGLQHKIHFFVPIMYKALSLAEP